MTGNFFATKKCCFCIVLVQHFCVKKGFVKKSFVIASKIRLCSRTTKFNFVTLLAKKFVFVFLQCLFEKTNFFRIKNSLFVTEISWFWYECNKKIKSHKKYSIFYSPFHVMMAALRLQSIRFEILSKELLMRKFLLLDSCFVRHFFVFEKSII